MNNRQHAQSGFTLIELMIIMIVISVLTALAFPTYASMVRRARYAEAKQQMGTIAKEVDVYRLENGSYPPDADPGEQPEGVSNWPKQEDIPYKSLYDYDHWGVGQNQCYVQIGYNGESGQRTYEVFQATKTTPGFKEVEDNLVLSVALYSCNAATGKIQ